jgi:hypothetical protein
LVDDAYGYLSQAMDIRLPRAEVSAFDGVVEKARNRIAIILIVFRSINTALCRD